MKIIETIQVNSKNTRETKNGKKVTSFKAYPFDFYIGGIFLPDFVQMGDFVTVYIDQIEVQDYNGKPQYNAKFPRVSKETLLSNSQGGHQTDTSMFGNSEPMDVSEEDLPF
ncbi:single-stranded DNA-binding protein [Brucella sp. CMUL 015]|uniref:single-stranded DNA-binding protein n=1 Tax=Brucella sp. CMUL 015 TaxID=1905697 RepID=UPI0009500242|nr:single-stranded DNA-binding protein [Brucella sp. CMUL 015]